MLWAGHSCPVTFHLSPEPLTVSEPRQPEISRKSWRNLRSHHRGDDNVDDFAVAAIGEQTMAPNDWDGWCDPVGGAASFTESLPGSAHRICRSTTGPCRAGRRDENRPYD